MREIWRGAGKGDGGEERRRRRGRGEERRREGGEDESKKTYVRLRWFPPPDYQPNLGKDYPEPG